MAYDMATPVGWYRQNSVCVSGSINVSALLAKCICTAFGNAPKTSNNASGRGRSKLSGMLKYISDSARRGGRTARWPTATSRIKYDASKGTWMTSMVTGGSCTGTRTTVACPGGV